MDINVKSELKKYSISVNPYLNTIINEEILKAKEFGNLQEEMLEYFKILVSAGKGIRGYLTTLGYELGGGTNIEEIQRVSTYIEVFHTSLLIQDDFMDRDEVRRKIETSHVKFSKSKEAGLVKIPADHFGASIALCLSDIGLYIAWKILLNSSFDNKLILQASKIHTDLTVRVALGQSLDISIPANKAAKEKDILNVIWTKSGEYTCLLPLWVGFTLSGNTDENKLSKLKDYAKCLGWAFQIQDDILGTFGDSSETGKPVGHDIREGKNTLLTLHLRNHGDKNQKKYLEQILGNNAATTKQIEKLKQIFIDAGSLDYVRNKGFEYADEGKKYLEKIDCDEKIKSKLASLLIFMMERTK